MKVLIVEDDPFKRSQIEQEIKLRFVAEVYSASSLQDAMNILVDTIFDAVLLDMAIPSHSGDAGSSDIYSQPVGGLDVLMYLSDEKRSERIMIVTQYPTIEYNRDHVPLNKIKSRFESDEIFNVDAISLFDEGGLWRPRLQEFLENVS